MKMYKLIALFLPCASLCFGASRAPTVQEEYNLALGAFQKKDWTDVIEHSKTMIKEHPTSPFLSEVTYLAGVAYFQKRDYEMADYYFSQFLDKYATAKYFEDALEYRFKIAEKFEEGAGLHMFGWEKMPKWLSAWEMAYDIYDKVITTLPRHEIAALSLKNKARMLTVDGKYKEAIDSYQMLIRRFPKHPSAPEAYISIAKLYLLESQEDYPGKDFLEQARLNLKKFRYDFPRENRLVEAEAILVEMQDRYAKDLWESAEYYLKKKKVRSAIMYLETLSRKYPSSRYTQGAMTQLVKVKKEHPELDMDPNKIISVKQ